MTAHIKLICLLLLISTSICQSSTCQDQQYIIPYSKLDQGFDISITAIRGQDQLVQLIQNPTAETAKTYILTIAPFSAPLFVMAGITFVIFVATIIQVICFNTCGKDCCGNEIKSSTYNVCCMRTMVAVFLILSFFVIAICIASLIVNSDLMKAVDYTTCNTQNIVYQTYNGNNNASIPWSGINNFDQQMELFASNIQNDVPFLNWYFTTNAYDSIVANTSGSLYQTSQQFTCTPDTTTVISCPFPNSVDCPTPYLAQFNQQYCNGTFNGSTLNLIQNEMSKNSTNWRIGTMNIKQSLLNINTNQSQVNSMVNQVRTFTNQVGNYQTQILNGIDFGSVVVDNLEISFYVFYSFIMTISLIGLVGVCMAYFCNNFRCRYLTYFLWYIFFLLSFLLFIASGIFLTTSIFTFDTCLAYPYYFEKQANFEQLDFGDTQIGDVFETCFFPASNTTSMFAAFNDTQVLTQFGSLYSQYMATVPSPKFSSVVTQIQNQLLSYSLNPQTVVIMNASSTQQPQAALNQFNTFANSSAANSAQACKYTHDYFTFNVVNCGIYLINTTVGNNRCMVFTDTNFGNTVTTTAAGLSALTNCTNPGVQGSTYQTSSDNLNAYSQQITTIVNNYVSVQSSLTNDLQQYEQNYFNYYEAVTNFYNSQTIQTFQGFISPYASLQLGSNCGFISSSMNGIVNIACNQLFPYINTLMALNIANSVLVFIMFILAYFLSTRLQFYEFLDGNFDNYGIETITTENLSKNYQLNTTNSRNVELLGTTNRSVN